MKRLSSRVYVTVFVKVFFYFNVCYFSSQGTIHDFSSERSMKLIIYTD